MAGLKKEAIEFYRKDLMKTKSGVDKIDAQFTTIL